ncbi:MAG TPA: S41 family peptidase [Gemmatimonadaceae bacterium]|nr:S41 family peptidase [Gemmatimonadaceae bacterium]
MKRFLFRTLLGAAGIAVAATAHAQTTPVTSTLALATFDSAWARIDRSFYDTTFLASRWRVLRDSLRPIAAGAKTNVQLRGVLNTLLASVGVSHFGIIPHEISPDFDEQPKSGRAITTAKATTASTAIANGTATSGTDARVGAEPGTIGVSLRLADGHLVVWKVDSTGPAWAQGVRPGVEVRSVEHASTADAIDQLAALGDESLRRNARMTAVMRANAMLAGPVGDTAVLVLGNVGAEQTYRVVRAPVRGVMSRFANLPQINAVFDTSTRAVHGPSGMRRIGVISFSVWLPALSDPLNRVFDRYRNADALVLDLRGNPGGLSGMINGIAGHLVDSAYTLGTLHMRGLTLQLKANPQRVSPEAKRVEPFSGPVVVIIDPLSASATEFFTAGLQGLGRVHVIGETSAGASVPALMGRLPNGDVMLHAIADHTDSKGRRIEGVGVVPDEIVPLKAAALRAGHDEAMEAALRWAAQQSGKKR